MATSNLYPPIIDTYQPAFLTAHWNTYFPNTIKVYFALSPYNKISFTQMAGAINPYYTQVSVKFQDSNKDYLCSKRISSTTNVNTTSSTTKNIRYNRPGYTSGIKLCTIKVDETVNSDYKYYIELSEADFSYLPIPLNKYFKVQIRFTSWDAAIDNGANGIINYWETIGHEYQYRNSTNDTGTSSYHNWTEMPNWIVNNKEYFSEWSTVTLIRRISKPYIRQSVFETNEGASYTGVYRSTTLEFLGQVVFADNSESETIDSYILHLYEKEKKAGAVAKSLERTEWIPADPYNNTNEIRYTFSTELEENSNKEYHLYIRYKTKNGYITSNPSEERKESVTPLDTIYHYTFNVSIVDKDLIPGTITSEPDAQRGSIKVILKDSTNYNGYAMFRRTSSRSNFKLWEDIYMIYVDSEDKLIKEFADYGETWDEIKYCQKETDYIPAAIVRTEDFMNNFYWYDCTVESGVFYKYGIQKIYLNDEEAST